MIDLTIKTLDSQNRSFNVPEDYTVRQLKEHIAESVNIAPDVQRLIYCGRVLVDENKLAQYNVQGKVIHLVERAPPSTSRGDPDGGSTSGEAGTMNGGGGGWRFLGGGGDPRRRRRGQDNTMYLGAMAIPTTNMMNGPVTSMPQGRPCLTTSRLMVARSMLNQATRSLARLENPRTPASEASTGTTAEPEVTSPAPTPGVSRRDSTSDSQSEDNDEANMNLAIQAHTAAAIVSAVSAVIQEDTAAPATGQNNIDITIEELESATREATEALSMLDDTEDAESPISPIVLSPETPPEENTEVPVESPSMETEPIPEPSAPPAPPAVSAPASDPPTQSSESSANESSSNTGAGSSQQARSPHSATPQSMATIIAQLDEFNRRLQPFMTQYYNLLHHDPNYEDPEIAQTAAEFNYPSSAAEADALFRSVSEMMHHLSHSYHALSDIVCSYSRQPASGRALRCRPVLIQHSAVLHAPVPLIVERAAQSSNRAGAAREGAASSQNATTNTSSNTAPATNAQDSTAAPAGAGPPRASFPGNNLDIFMELGPTITIDSVEATFLPRGAASQGSVGGSAPGHIAPGAFPWGTPPPPELIQNLVQAVSERMGEAGGAETNFHIEFPEVRTEFTIGLEGARGPTPAPPAAAATTAQATSPSGGARVADSTQNSTARGNTETHPTTATQTRSTSRPQILLARNLQNVARNLTNTMRTFDPFLPCNSHHIHIRNRRNGSTRSTQSQAWQSGGNNNNNNAATQANNVRPATSGVTADMMAPGSEAASAPFRHIVDSILSQSQGAGGSPNILALGPFSTGQATANISFEIGRVTPLTLNTSGLAAMGAAAMGAAAGQQTTGDSPQSPPISEQGAAQGGNAGGGGGFLSTLLGQLGNFLPQAANAEFLSGMQNPAGSGGSPGGAEQPGAGPWVEISRPANDFMASLLQNIAGQNPAQHIQVMRPQAAAAPVNPPTSSAPAYPVLAALMHTLRSHEGAAQTHSLAQLLGLALREPAPARPAFVPDLIHTILSTVQWRDMTPQAAAPEGRTPDLRDLRAFMTRRFPNSVTRDSSARYCRLILDETENYFNSLDDVLSPLARGIDFRATLERLNSGLLTGLFYQLEATAENRPGAYLTLLTSLRKYIQILLALLGECFGSTYLSGLLRMIGHREISGVLPEDDFRNQGTVQSFVCSKPAQIDSVLTVLKSLLAEVTQEIPVARTRDLLVHSRELPRPPRVGVTPQATSNPGPRGGEPMDIEAAANVSQVASAPVNTRPDDPLPDNIIIGSESWHNTIPSDWVPLIARDSQRQRRESNQGPFSDGYLSVMPTKRRKVVTSSKPSTNLSKVITDTMATALGAAGVSTSSDSLPAAAADDPALRVAYREQVRAQLSESLASSPDFSSERYPNSAKFFNSKKKQ